VLTGPHAILSYEWAEEFGMNDVPREADALAPFLKRCRERLLDLSGRNPLLCSNRSRATKLQIVRPSGQALMLLLGEEGASVRLPLVRASNRRARSDPNADAQWSVEPGDVELSPQPPQDLFRKLRRLYDNARTSVEERGVTILHLTVGMLKWADARLGEDCHSPLLLVPCRLSSEGPDKPLLLERADEEIQLNPALELYLRERHKLRLPQEPEDWLERTIVAFLGEVSSMAGERGWTVGDESWLATLSFEGLVLHRDLETMAGAAVQHPVVRSLGGVGSDLGASESLPSDLDTLPPGSVTPLTILGADSSQLEALTYAAKGAHVVIHGPPGTGKSRTITNLIADALGRGKKVLFVSAKMAALEVVHRWLEREGLGDFCLEAHSTKAGKAKIAEELRRILGKAEPEGDPRLSERLEDLLERRDALNAYVRALHAIQPALGASLYQAFGQLERLAAGPTISFALPWPNVLAVDAKALRRAVQALEKLEGHERVYQERDRHPWRGFASTPEAISGVDAALRKVTDDAREIAEAANRLPFLQDPARLSLDQFQNLAPGIAAMAEVEALPAQWWVATPALLASRAEQLENLAGAIDRLAAANAELHGFIRPQRAEAQQLFRRGLQEFANWPRVFRPSYYRWKRAVAEIVLPGKPRGFSAVAQYLRLCDEIEALETTQARLLEGLGEIGGGRFPTADQARSFARSHRAARVLRECLRAVELPSAPFAELTPDARRTARSLLDLLPERNAPLSAAVLGLNASWPEGFCEGQPAQRSRIGALLERGEELLVAMARLHEWTGMSAALADAKALKLESLLRATGPLPLRSTCQALKRRFWEAWCNARIAAEPALARFSGRTHAKLLEEFAAHDQRVQRAVRRAIVARARAPRHTLQGAPNISGGEVALLRRELQKKKRIKPLRKLFAEIPNALQALKPCMLMSPISVSTFLPPDRVHFDLVVFDEASQLPTPEAIPAILRARQVVVAGDSKQLPPTNFFQASSEEEDVDEGEVEPLESVLDQCVAVVPAFRECNLKWHYRSQDDRLIQFSNYEFYDNSLITFPPAFDRHPGRGVRLVPVPDGAYDRGKSRTNRIEARRVARLVFELARAFPNESLGVVAMSSAQREAIEDALEEEAATAPVALAPLQQHATEPFFVKSLENVQGDERDRIVISVGYGKDGAGGMSLNLGPINSAHGWRRLNVLVTRARLETIVVSTVTEQDLAGLSPTNRGGIALRSFLRYVAQGGRLDRGVGQVTDGETNDFEDAVQAALEARGFSVQPQVGVGTYRIDLGVRDPVEPHQYAIGVECDGATYHSSRTARDRDLLRQEALKKMDWRLYRVWSTDWFKNRDATLEALVAEVNRAIEMNRGLRSGVLVEAPRAVSSPVEQLTDPGRPPGVAPTSPPTATSRYSAGVPYEAFRGEQMRRDVLIEASERRALAQALRLIVDAEWPIHEEETLDRLMELADVRRAGSNVRTNFEAALKLAVQHGVESRASFLWPVGRTKPRAFRRPTESVARPMSRIAPEEIRLAVLHLVEQSFSVQRESLAKEVVRLFGSERISGGAADAVRVVIDELVEEGLLRAAGPNVALQ